MRSLLDKPPRGFYLANEVGRLAGVSGNLIGQWAKNGYIRSSQSEPGEIPRVYSYQDVAEAMVVHMLIEHEYKYPVIKSALEALRRDSEMGNWPLAKAKLMGAGANRETILVRKGDRAFDLTGKPWHEMIDVGDLAQIARDLERGGWAARNMPDLKHIEVDPDRLSGRPAIRGKRVFAESAARLADSHEGWLILQDEYGLNKAEINDAQRWWSAVREYEPTA
jgi:uncharacterized protein (DUF433 family)